MNSTGGEIAVSTLNQGSCGSYLALPSGVKAMEFYITTLTPTVAKSLSMAVICKEISSVVITFGGRSTDEILFGVKTYNGSKREVFTCSPKSILYFRTSADISGTRIQSNKNISVLVGDRFLDTGSNTLSDFVVSQFPPVSSYGTRFVVPPVPFSNNQYIIRVVASKNGEVTVSGELSPVALAQGGMATFDIIDNRAVYISSTAPLLVVQYFKSPPTQGFAGGPSSVIIVPQENFRSSYSLHVNSYAENAYIMLVSEHNQNALLDGGDHALIWTSVASSGFYYAQISAASGGHYITLANSGKFGAYVYASKGTECALGFPAGMNLVGYQAVSSVSIS